MAVALSRSPLELSELTDSAAPVAVPSAVILPLVAVRTTAGLVKAVPAGLAAAMLPFVLLSENMTLADGALGELFKSTVDACCGLKINQTFP